MVPVGHTLLEIFFWVCVCAARKRFACMRMFVTKSYKSVCVPYNYISVDKKDAKELAMIGFTSTSSHLCETETFRLFLSSSKEH